MRAHAVPADPVGVEHGAVGAGADHPGPAVVAAHGQDARHADPDAAGHGLLDRDLDVDVAAEPLPRRAGGGGDRGEHGHRPARRDRRRAVVGAAERPVEQVGEGVGDPAPAPRAAVVGGDEDLTGVRTARRDRVADAVDVAEPGGVAGPDDGVDPDPGGGLLRGPRERRGAVAAADEDQPGAGRRQGEAGAERADDVDDAPDVLLAHPRRPGAVGGDDDLDRAGRGVGAVDAERPAQEHRRGRPADGDGDELPRPGRRRGRRGEDEVAVRAGVRRGDDLGADLRGRARHRWPSRSREICAACCWRLMTSNPPAMTASMPCTAADSCWTVVMIGASTVVVAARMS